MPTIDMRWFRAARAGIVLGLTVGLLSIIGAATPVSAHTEFESSVPVEGDAVDAPVEEVVVTFTSAAEPAGDGFQVLDGDGSVRVPTSIVVDEGRVFRLLFDPPLAGGDVGVRWDVRSSDTHRISGSFSFTVTAALPTTSIATTTAPTPSTSVEPVPDAAAPGPLVTEPGAGTGGEAQPPATDSTPASSATLDDFLVVDDSSDGDALARTGRLVAFIGVVFGLGALAFTSAALVGTRREIRSALRAVRVLGLAIAVGAVVEYTGVAQLIDESVSSAWSTSAGAATVLRLLGGLALALGLRATVVSLRRPAPLSADVVTAPSEPTAQRRDPASHVDDRIRWRPDRGSIPAGLGAIAVLASFWFDGHTVTKGFRPLHAIVDTVHVASAAIWVGGVAALAGIAWSRHRAGRPARFGELVVRFSSIATVSLIAVSVAGAAMTLMITDSLDDLTGTEWGQLLLLKLGAVGIATAFGAYHHRRLRPAFEADPDDPAVLLAARNTLTAEAIVLAFVVVVTVWLVVAPV